MWLHRFARLVAAGTLLLIVAGGLVTSTGSGLAVPDWPTSYGYFMFSFPLSKMVGGIYYEHGHRLIASTVGMLTIALAAWLWWQERRRWVRRLGVLALVAVVLQGVLGGITVLYFLPAPISVAHAGLAQMFFCLTVTIALVTSDGWRRRYSCAATETRPDPSGDRWLARLTIATSATLYLQILVGATMRHTGAGLAIPDFPLSFGALVPPRWTMAIAINFIHRIGAVVVAVLVCSTFIRVFARHKDRLELVKPTVLAVLLVAAQITLGAMTVLTKKAVEVNTAHVATGAVLLATCLLLTLRVHRTRLDEVAAHDQGLEPSSFTPAAAGPLAFDVRRSGR
ncbi:MAG: heme A synthase [Acidobacteria bacterium]|nr:heme A synthase [Acidobacteriota bacterium]